MTYSKNLIPPNENIFKNEGIFIYSANDIAPADDIIP